MELAEDPPLEEEVLPRGTGFNINPVTYGTVSESADGMLLWTANKSSHSYTEIVLLIIKTLVVVSWCLGLLPLFLHVEATDGT